MTTKHARGRGVPPTPRLPREPRRRISFRLHRTRRRLQDALTDLRAVAAALPTARPGNRRLTSDWHLCLSGALTEVVRLLQEVERCQRGVLAWVPEDEKQAAFRRLAIAWDGSALEGEAARQGCRAAAGSAAA